MGPPSFLHEEEGVGGKGVGGLWILGLCSCATQCLYWLCWLWRTLDWDCDVSDSSGSDIATDLYWIWAYQKVGLTSIYRIMVTATLADRYPAALHIFRNYEQPFEEPHTDNDDAKRFPHQTPPTGERSFVCSKNNSRLVFCLVKILYLRCYDLPLCAFQEYSLLCALMTAWNCTQWASYGWDNRSQW